jgi:hypothetical protein
VIEEAGRGDHQLAPPVPVVVELPQRLHAHGLDRLPGSQDRAAVRVPLPERLAVQLEDEVVGGVLHGRDLFQDHLALQFQVLGPEERVQDQVRQDLQGVRQVLGEDPGLEGGVLPGREGVQGTPQPFHGEGDQPRTPGPRSAP